MSGGKFITIFFCCRTGGSPYVVFLLLAHRNCQITATSSPPQQENIDLISSQIKRNYNAEPREAGEINNGERCVVFTATALASLLQRKEIFIVRLVCSQLPLLLKTLGKISFTDVESRRYCFQR